jgi:hypothetical protein
MSFNFGSNIGIGGFNPPGMRDSLHPTQDMKAKATPVKGPTDNRPTVDSKDHSHNVGYGDLNPPDKNSTPDWVYPGNEVGPDHPMFKGGGGGGEQKGQKGSKEDSDSHRIPEARFDPYGPPSTSLGKNIEHNPDHLRKPYFRKEDEK